MPEALSTSPETLTIDAQQAEVNRLVARVLDEHLDFVAHPNGLGMMELSEELVAAWVALGSLADEALAAIGFKVVSRTKDVYQLMAVAIEAENG